MEIEPKIETELIEEPEEYTCGNLYDNFVSITTPEGITIEVHSNELSFGALRDEAIDLLDMVVETEDEPEEPEE